MRKLIGAKGALIAAVCGVVLLSACAPARKVEIVGSAGPLVFPAPPDEPRFIFERAFYSAADVQSVSEEDKLKNLLTGEKTGMQALVKPYAVAAQGGKMYVTDSVARVVHVFDVPNGKYSELMEVGDGVLQKPLGVDVDRQGRVYVADGTHRYVFVFDPSGKYSKRIGGPSFFDRLSSVTVDPDGKRIYAVDIGGVSSQNHRVRVFDVDTGAHVMDIGQRGTGAGEFNLPRDLAIGRDGRLYVVDGGNFRVQVFDAEGRYLTSFGKVGRQFGDFSRPKEIATDAEGNVYVVDTAFGNYQIFSPDGELLLFVGDRSEVDRPAKYMLPSGIFVDEDGRVYVVDQWFKKVEVYRPANIPEFGGALVEKSAKARSLTNASKSSN